MIDRLFLAILVLNATALFGFLAPQFGLSISQVSQTLLAFNLLYLISKAHVVQRLLARTEIAQWCFLLLLWPLATLAYAPSFELRQIGLQLYFFTLFLGALVFAAANGVRRIRQLLELSIAITTVGLALSLVSPEYFEAVAELASAKTVKEGRAFGFFLQPNKLATSLTLLFLAWFPLRRTKNTIADAVTIATFMVVILLTGSRTGILMSVVVVGLLALNLWKTGGAQGRSIVRVALLLGVLATGAAGLREYLAQLEYRDARRDDLISRMETLLNFELSDDGSLGEDGSIRARLDAQTVYWHLIEEKPILGHGFGSETYFRRLGPIFLTSHSDFLATAAEYGIAYPLWFIYALVAMYRRNERKTAEAILEANTIAQFTAVVLLLFVGSSIIHSRTFYVIWGALAATAYFPRNVFAQDSARGVIVRNATRVSGPRTSWAPRNPALDVAARHPARPPLGEGLAR